MTEMVEEEEEEVMMVAFKQEEGPIGLMEHDLNVKCMEILVMWLGTIFTGLIKTI